MLWHLSHRCDPEVRPLADRHYNHQHIGAVNFAPPGRCLVLKTEAADAFWITSWPFAEYVRHEWAGAWICSAFRNESPHLSSELIRQALACTRFYWGDAPEPFGMITFVNDKMVRRKRDPGRCYIKAGFRRIGYTQGGLIALQLKPSEMPMPESAIGQQMRLMA